MIWPFRRRPPPIGRLGEDAAVKHLRRCGYVILDRNLRIGRYEVDILAMEEDTIVFVEVKTRARAGLFAPEDNVTHEKREHLRRAARQYMERRNDPGVYCRFDIVSVVITEDGRPEVVLLRDAFPGQ